MITLDAMHYLLRSSINTPKVRGIVLPDNKELLNIQILEDTTIFVELEKNVDNLVHKLDFFCKASGARIFKIKSIMLGLIDNPYGWFEKYNFQWGSSKTSKIPWDSICNQS